MFTVTCLIYHVKIQYWLGLRRFGAGQRTKENRTNPNKTQILNQMCWRRKEKRKYQYDVAGEESNRWPYAELTRETENDILHFKRPVVLHGIWSRFHPRTDPVRVPFHLSWVLQVTMSIQYSPILDLMNLEHLCIIFF